MIVMMVEGTYFLADWLVQTVFVSDFVSSHLKLTALPALRPQSFQILPSMATSRIFHSPPLECETVWD